MGSDSTNIMLGCLSGEKYQVRAFRATPAEDLEKKELRIVIERKTNDDWARVEIKEQDIERVIEAMQFLYQTRYDIKTDRSCIS